MRALIDRRTSHLAQVDVAEELEDCQFTDARILVARAVEDVVQYLDHLIPSQMQPSLLPLVSPISRSSTHCSSLIHLIDSLFMSTFSQYQYPIKH